MSKLKPSFYLSLKFIEAIDYARQAHAEQTRKGKHVPYIAHLLGVSSLVLDYGGDEEQCIAGLLHDVIEDCGSGHEAAIRQQFGERVARIVLACTDSTEEAKAALVTPEDKLADWHQRKRAYVAHLRGEKADALLVSCCDKLQNASAIVADLEEPGIGRAVFERFTAKRDGTLRYYHSIAEVFVQRKVRPASALDTVVKRMHALAGVRSRKGLD